MIESPCVSVVVASRNRAGLLANMLDALAGQRWPRDRYEIVVADNGSTDATPEVVGVRARSEHGPPVRYLHVPERGKSVAVNRALEAAAGEIIAFTDDDVTPES